MGKIRYLVLEDGSYFKGKAIGSSDYKISEIVSNTTMIGYQEILSDNSYCEQIVTLTYPMIGGYGITREGMENLNPSLNGLVIGENCEYPSNWKTEITLDDYLKEKNISAIEGIDTRMLAKKLRKLGNTKAVFVDDISNIENIIDNIKNTSLDDNLVEKVSVKKPFRIPNEGKKVVIVDLGVINDLLKVFISKGYDITVVPYNTSAKEIMSLNPDGVVFSNGPGNPNIYSQISNAIKQLNSKLAILGIGLGHQLIAKSKGLEIEKLDFAHRGGNYPVKNIEKNIIENVVKNTSYTVSFNDIEDKFNVIYKGVNSNTIEALENQKEKVITSQFSPITKFENITNDIFDKFYEYMNGDDNE